MAIDGTETIAGASPFAGTGQHRRDFLARARNDAPRNPWNMGWGRQGKKVVTSLLRQSDRSARRAGLRPDQAMEEAVWRGQRYEKNADSGAFEVPPDRSRRISVTLSLSLARVPLFDPTEVGESASRLGSAMCPRNSRHPSCAPAMCPSLHRADASSLRQSRAPYL